MLAVLRSWLTTFWLAFMHSKQMHLSFSCQVNVAAFALRSQDVTSRFLAGIGNTSCLWAGAWAAFAFVPDCHDEVLSPDAACMCHPGTFERNLMEALRARTAAQAPAEAAAAAPAAATEAPAAADGSAGAALQQEGQVRGSRLRAALHASTCCSLLPCSPAGFCESTILMAEAIALLNLNDQ